MRIGITSPVVVQVPGAASPWEATATVEDLVTIAAAADRLGFHHLTCSEHVAVPVDVATQRGATYWDPLATLSFLAAVTQRIRLVTQVLVLGYHHPLEIAKRYGTLDRLSGGRLTLGLGVGSLREEFDLLGAPFADRGARADEALSAITSSLGTREPSFHGQYYEYSGIVVDPCAVQARVPIWIGGRSRRSLQRAAAHAQGWVPFGLALGELSQLLGEFELPGDFEVVLSAGRPLDPVGQPDQVRHALERVTAAGATIVGASLAAESAGHYVEQLHALASLRDVARAEQTP